MALATLGAPGAFGATASWEFDTASYNFGPAILGSGPTEPHPFVLTNTGETPLMAAGWRISWRGYPPVDPELLQVTSDGCHNLEPQESCSVSVSFSPTYPGPKKGTLRIPTRNGELPPAFVELEGEGVGPWVSIEPGHLNFEPVEIGKGASPAQRITVENRGNLNLTIQGISFTDLLGVPQSPSPFRIVGGSCHEGQVVAPESSCTIEVVLAPSEPGSFQSKLEITDDASGSPQTIEVQGTGKATTTEVVLRSGSPAVRITHRPTDASRKRAATFWFVAAPVNAVTECELDHLGFEPCSAPRRYTHLSIGRHEFKVRAADPSGGSASASARFHWRIKARH